MYLLTWVANNATFLTVCVWWSKVPWTVLVFIDMTAHLWLCVWCTCSSGVCALKYWFVGVPVVIREDVGLIPGLVQWVKDPALAPAAVRVVDVAPIRLLWRWWRPAAAAPIWPLTWEHSYATGVALKRRKKKKYWFVAKLLLFLPTVWEVYSDLPLTVNVPVFLTGYYQFYFFFLPTWQR